MQSKGAAMKEKFPEKYAILLLGPPGVGKFEYTLDMAWDYLRKGDSVIYITTERSPEEVKERAKSMGLELERYEGKGLIFIDVYSWSVRKKYDAGLSIDNPSNLNEININIKKAVDRLPPSRRLIFDSLSPLFLHNPPEAVTKFFQVLTSRTKAEYGSILCTLQDGVHDPRVVNTLIYLVDGLLEMEYEEGEKLIRKLRIHHLRGMQIKQGWIKFDVTEKGFKLMDI
jgi:KaiC/GvpD/RAD55 family RecA-like ATPase